MISMASTINASISEARKEWGWFLALGLALIALGIFAIVYDTTATYATAFALGLLLFIAGILQLAMVFRAHGAGHVILFLFFGALEIVVGSVLMKSPAAGALAITLVLAVYFMFSGLMRIIYSLWLQFPQYGWSVFTGLISVALGVILWAEWPVSGMWFLGIAVGVNFIFSGVLWSALALQLKSATSASTS